MGRTSSRTSSSQNWVLYVWLAAIYAVLSLFLSNIDLFDASEVLVILIVILLVISLLLFGLYRLFRNIPQSALISFLVVVGFFSYGHFYNLISAIAEDGPLTQHVVCFPAALAAVILLIYSVIRHPWVAARLTLVFNFMMVVLVCFPLLKVIDYYYYAATIDITPPAPVDLTYAGPGPLPDIYYIILDGYSREDWLAEWFGFDNSDFLKALEARGFYVADRSCSNYLQTDLSIPSALSMQYLDLPDMGWFGKQRERVFLQYYLSKYNRVATSLMDEGYTYIHFATHFLITSFDRRADLVIDFRRSGPYSTTDPEAQEAFLKALLPTTLFRPFYETIRDIDHRDVPLSFEDPKRVLMVLDTLKTIPSRRESTFTFVHIIKPHSPYNFDRQGNIVSSSRNHNWDNIDIAGYTEQVRFINTRMLDVIDTLLADSDIPPIIIIQGDHGWQATDDWTNWRAPILNAYLVPDATRALLYPTISPVNSFRVIFDSAFGSHLDLLDDVSYSSAYGTPFDTKLIEGEFRQTWCPDS